jgi:adenylate kinase family enzyme
MAPPVRVHIFGASGSGTTTLGRTLAERLGVRFFDGDDYFWERRADCPAAT